MSLLYARTLVRACALSLALAPFLLFSSATAQTPPPAVADWRWGGLIHDVFMLDANTGWSVEDGGRIRKSTNATSASPTWTPQSTPKEVQNTLRRVFFLDADLGWAVGIDGWVIHTTNGGTNWNLLSRIPAWHGSGYEDLWDVLFLDADRGWVIGLHSLWYTTNATSANPLWAQASLYDYTGQPITDPTQIELYALDVVERSSGLVGLASAEPGLIFRALSELDWQVVFEIKSLCPQFCTSPPPGYLFGCACDAICDAGVHAELWDIKISRHPNLQQKLAICVGGAGNGCGYVLASDNDGASWQLEEHECRCCHACATDPDYNPPGDPQTNTWHLKKFFELYGVAIVHSNNSAIAGGYKGQHVVRDPGAVPKPWRDRSDYAGDPFNPDSVTLPVYGAATPMSSTASPGPALLTANGGYIRKTTDGGDNWDTTDPPGEPWRIRDVYFIDDMNGWMVSQFYRIARTTDAGETWSPDVTGAALGQGFLNAITFDSSGTLAVAVGDVDPVLNRPKIFFNLDALNFTQWAEPSVVYDLFPDEAVATEGLREVAWAGGVEFWAVGWLGQIYQSHPVQGPDVWTQFAPPGQTYAQIADFKLEGVAFASPADGLFVGQRPVVGVPAGKAYHYRPGHATPWQELTVDQSITALLDVALDNAGTSLYLVGLRGATNEGVVLSATRGAIGDDFGSFTNELTAGACTLGEALGDLGVLTEVEVDWAGNVWIAGECGRLWRRAAGGGPWDPIRSLTDAHVRGMSFPRNFADTGFIAGHRSGRTQHSIVRVSPPSTP